MRRYNLFFIQPYAQQCTVPGREQRWQVVHHQSGEQAVALNATDAADWLADRANAPAGAGSAAPTERHSASLQGDQ